MICTVSPLKHRKIWIHLNTTKYTAQFLRYKSLKSLTLKCPLLTGLAEQTNPAVMFSSVTVCGQIGHRFHRQSQSNHWHSIQTHHSRTAWSMMSWLTGRQQTPLGCSDLMQQSIECVTASEESPLVTSLNYNIYLALKLWWWFWLPLWKPPYEFTAINNVIIMLLSQLFQ